jgi:undecaprenyl-diphosphatase
LLSIPTMTVATLWEGLKAVGLRKSGDGETAQPIDMTADKWIVLVIGFVISFFVAWAVVAWFMGWVRKRGFTAFAVYRIILGTLVLVLVSMGHLKPDEETAPAPTPHNATVHVAALSEAPGK